MFCASRTAAEPAALPIHLDCIVLTKNRERIPSLEFLIIENSGWAEV
jgi:hypothetical protein